MATWTAALHWHTSLISTDIHFCVCSMAFAICNSGGRRADPWFYRSGDDTAYIAKQCKSPDIRQQA